MSFFLKTLMHAIAVIIVHVVVVVVVVVLDYLTNIKFSHSK